MIVRLIIIISFCFFMILHCSSLGMYIVIVANLLYAKTACKTFLHVV